jgi:hypothetical protein
MFTGDFVDENGEVRAENFAGFAAAFVEALKAQEHATTVLVGLHDGLVFLGLG